ncbi:transporter substrate-binding domain-containing protein [Ramlibacter sp. PS3R-8]|uniref:transporter substrate-binding domain-containing protein n=1 Tax=Ramlibacter sp. PS3R-8 TaxID=3133437 RepID=UPI0030AE9E9F
MKTMLAAPVLRRRALLAALVATTALAGCAVPVRPAAPPAPAEVVRVLAPTGTLRVAVYPGSPTSLVEQAAPENMRGVSVDLGRSLASRLGVPARIVVFPRLAESLTAVQRGEADFLITNATAERARLVDFAPTLVDLELGVLVTPASRIPAITRLDTPGVSVGVSQGSSSERVLGNQLKQAAVRSYPSLDVARAALQAGEIDGFATNKAILFEMADKLPGSRLLEGRWGTEHLAPGIPKGREAGLPFLRDFTQDVQRNGELDRAVRRAGLRGTAEPAR